MPSQAAAADLTFGDLTLASSQFDESQMNAHFRLGVLRRCPKNSDSAQNPVPEKSDPLVPNSLTAAQLANPWDQILHCKRVRGGPVMTSRGHDLQPLPTKTPSRSNHVDSVSYENDLVEPPYLQELSTFHSILISGPRSVFHHKIRRLHTQFHEEVVHDPRARRTRLRRIGLSAADDYWTGIPLMIKSARA